MRPMRINLCPCRRSVLYEEAFPNDVKVVCSMRFTYDSEAEAESVLAAVQTDNEDYVKTHLEGSSVVSEVLAGSIPSLLHTLDDYLSCLTVAEDIIEKRSRRAPL